MLKSLYFCLIRAGKYNPKSITSGLSLRITRQQSTSTMKKIPFITASFLILSLVVSSCSTNKMAARATEDNLYFMASDVAIATQYAVANNNPQSFKNISQEPELAEQNFSARNVNPEYISRYQATENSSADEVVYFEEGVSNQNQVGNINAYDNYSTLGNRNNGFNSPNINFNFGMGMGFGGMMSPWGFYDPFWGPGFGFRPGFSIGLGIGWGSPFMGGGFGWGNPWRNPYMGFGSMMSPWGFYDPFFGPGFGMMGYGMGFSPWGRPIYAGRPIFILPGGEGDRRTVYGARPTRGATLANSGMRSSQAGVLPSTARAQARGNASTVNNSSARRLVSSENSRVASRDFSNSQNDYYNSGRSRVTPTTRNTSSPASDRGVSTGSRSSIPSARTPNTLTPGSTTRNYSPSGTASPAYNNSRSTSPSYNRSNAPAYNRSTSPSYNRSTAPSYNRSATPTNNSRVVTPSRTNSTPTYSAPSRSSGGGSISAPSRSSGGSSGGTVGGSRGGRGN
jgi:hypothetical protein